MVFVSILYSHGNSKLDVCCVPLVSGSGWHWGNCFQRASNHGPRPLIGRREYEKDGRDGGQEERREGRSDDDRGHDVTMWI